MAGASPWQLRAQGGTTLDRTPFHAGTLTPTPTHTGTPFTHVHISVMWEETGVPEKTHADLGKPCTLHRQGPPARN